MQEPSRTLEDPNRALDRALGARLLREQPAALIAHLVLAGAVLAFLWGAAPAAPLLGWAAALFLAISARALAVKRLDPRTLSPRTLLGRLRLLVTASGLAWGVGAAMLTPELDSVQWALILVVLSGLVASGAATLAADQVAYRLFLVGTLAPMPIAILMHGRDRAHVFAVLLVAFFVGFVVMLNGRMHRMLVRHLRAADAVVRARDAAERAARARSAFLANMSHEIRTPMNAILGLTELALGSELSAEQQRQIQLAHGAADGLLTILNDILDFSKIEGDHLTLETIPFELPGLAHSAARLLAVRAHERRVELLCEVSPDVPRMVLGDPGRLRQVLTNLVGNAIKFTHEGEIAVRVSVDARTDAEAVVAFAVRDTGIGIPPDKLDAIFDAFGQADVSTTRKYGGTGLGLAISQRLVRLMGGEIRVRSEPGKGSEFRFAVRFPVETASADVSERRPLEGTRTLVVDDNATNRRLVTGMFAAAGVSVDEAENADAGIAALRRAHASGAPYELVIIDCHMPGRDGFDLAADVMRDPDLRAVRLLMLTSGGVRGDGQRCRELGIRGYLTKPVSQAELLDAAVAVLGPASPAAVVTRHSIAEARRSLRLLLAEDNPVNQEVAATMLRARGHRVDVVGNGREAVEAVASRHYDLVLMDVQMPEMDGLAATGAIRATAGREATPIVALTAHASGVERERCIAAGMNDYLSKPFKAHELFAMVEETAAKAAPAAPVDLEAFRDTMREAGAEAAVDGIVALFGAGARERLAAVRAALGTGDAGAIAKAAHAFRSAAGTVGAQRLAALLQEVEGAARDGAVERARGYLPRLTGEVQTILQYLEGASAHARPDR